MTPTPAPARAPSSRGPVDPPGDVLLVEDQPDHAQLIELLLQRAPGWNWAVRWANTLQEAEDLAAQRRPAVVLLDMNLPDSQGLATVAHFCGRHPEVPVVVATSHEAEIGVEAVRQGAQDFLVKGAFDAPLLTRSLRLAIARKEGQLAAEALARSQRYLQAIIDSEPECLKVLAANGTVLEMNPAGLAMLHAGREEVIGRPASTFLHPDDQAAFLDACQRAASGQRTTVRVRALALDGTELRMESTLTALDEAGEGAVLGLTRDVSEQARAEEALRRSEERYRLLFESNPQPMWVYDAGTLRFLAVNDAALRQYGFGRHEFLDMTILDIRPESGRAVLETRLRNGAAEARSSTTRHRRRDGTEFDVEVTSRPFVLDGRSGRLVVAADVTEQRRVEGQLRQAQKMEALGRLAGGVSHDFNNLLGVISGYSELALRAVDPESTLGRRIAEIRKAAGRAAELTSQLLAFSRQQVLEPQVVHLNAVVAEAERMLHRLIGEHIQLVTLLSEGLGQVKADPGQITQIVLNLAVNARDAMPRGGRLLVETANVELDARYALTHPEVVPGRYVMLCVTDTGLGMDAETKARLFEPFFTTKPAGEGTGLGLATVYGIVHQSGGHVAVYSEPGHGTAFRIYLPRVEGAVAAGPEPSPDLPPGGGETILVVEDDAALREMTREVLEEAGYRVIPASAGDEALAVARDEPGPIDLVLTDVVMPRMTGPDLARRLAEWRPRTRILFMSGYTEGAVLDQGTPAGGGAFVAKPFTPERLLSRVRDVLSAPSRPEAG